MLVGKSSSRTAEGIAVSGSVGSMVFDGEDAGGGESLVSSSGSISTSFTVFFLLFLIIKTAMIIPVRSRNNEIPPPIIRSIIGLDRVFERSDLEPSVSLIVIVAVDWLFPYMR